MVHISVLMKEVLSSLDPKSGQDFIDATVGEGGHAKMILEKTGPNGRLLGIDQSESVLRETKTFLADYGGRTVLIEGNFAEIAGIAEEYNFNKVDGILFDLGISLWHIGQSGKGFSFDKDEPLIMKFGAAWETSGELTAEKIINEWPEEKIAEIFREYGEERHSRKMAHVIAEKRKEEKIKTSKQLADIISDNYPKRYLLKIHPATKIFQALRIAVNNELENLRSALPQAIGLLKPGGRLGIISFHSLEDRIVKEYFRRESRDCICPPDFLVCQCKHKATLKILTKKPLVATSEEIEENFGSRSAKFRVAEKIIQ